MVNKLKKILEEQLSIDYGCSLQEIQSKENIFRLKVQKQGMRLVGEQDSLFKMAVYNEKLLVMAEERLLEWFKEEFKGKSGVWISEPETLVCIHEKLKTCGQVLADAHHYYIPSENKVEMSKRFEVVWYDRQEILQFKGDKRFNEAFLFDEEIPDMLAVSAVEDGKILGMAGATRDCENMWQFGVNVTEEGRGMGVGSYVVALLKERVLAEGRVPLYSTVESHIKSQKVAFQAGFEPAFYEIFSRKV